MSTLLEHYLNTRRFTETLCKPLGIEDYIPQPVEYVSPPKWHLAHVTWFFEEMLLKDSVDGYAIFDSDFGFLFNSYYRSLGKRTVRAERGNMTRPTVDQVYEYRRYVDEHMCQLLSDPVCAAIQEKVLLGIHHEQQHQELLITDLKYIFACNPRQPKYESRFDLVADKNHEDGWVTMPEGIYEIGHDDTSFCFDNELARHKVFLHGYQISQSLVTNEDYLGFIEDGGYSNFSYWLDDGWSWVCENKIKSPLYWQQIDGAWFYYTLAGLKPMAREAMLAHVSYYEAHAFANWKGMRLPTEFEWEAACRQFQWGKRWEWTASAYHPYPNFKITEGALGEYNGKFMVNQMVLRGASKATPKGHSRATYRNFLHPHFQWQYCGIRLAK